MTTLRKLIRIQLDQLVDLVPRPPDAFFVDWCCRLCRHRAGALDRETALNQAAKHMQLVHPCMWWDPLRQEEEVIRIHDRDWPPTEQVKPPLRPVMVEVLAGFLLFLLAPLAAWFVAALPGSHPWATALWPAGWAVAVVVLFVGNQIRERRSS